MSISLTEFVDGINPSNTVLFFGSGSSIPSGAPSVPALIEIISARFELDADGFSLPEVASIAEYKHPRHELIQCIRPAFTKLRVTGSMLNLPLYEWKNIYTTNYDTLVEQSYERKKQPLSIYSSNFDFKEQEIPSATKLYKLHGSIEKDISDGHQSRIVISEADYDNTSEYREFLWDAFKNDLNGANLVVIGYSLSDQHIKDLVDRVISINGKSPVQSSVGLLLYTADENRALLYERRGINVAFGGVDEFFIELEKRSSPKSLRYIATGDPLDNHNALQPVTLKVADELVNIEKNVSLMFDGWPATYSDIKAGLTFDRTVAHDSYSSITDDTILSVCFLGASGVGKSTVARKLLLQLRETRDHCWEHKSMHKLLQEDWRSVAATLKKRNEHGVLFVDDAHNHLRELNSLMDLLSADDNNHLKLILTSARNQWNPRIKSPNLFSKGKEYILSKLDDNEVEGLLTLVETHPDLQPLVEDSFSGFSRTERKRRLVAKCDSDAFVCLKNIFASEPFDGIVLREYANLDGALQHIYKLVSAMESAGINVHRQLVIRLLGIPSDSVSASLTNLVDIIHEYTINDREGIYGWRGRHGVITDIIAKYKMSNDDEYYALFETVIDNIIPTYDVEIRTIKQLCSFDSGISRFPDKHVRNKLLRKMISKVPGERVPRHRLIRYLIDLNEFEKAETEIRLFENDFRSEGPLERFKVLLLLLRAEKTIGIMDEDRVAMLDMAHKRSLKAVEKYKDNKNILKTYCDVGLQIFKRTGNSEVYQDSIEELKAAEIRIGDPEITNVLMQSERAYAHIQNQKLEEEAEV